jgi:hypothetical protein
MSDSDLQLPPLFPHLFPVQDTNTASPAFISSLETVDYSGPPGERCPITLTDFDEGVHVCILPCSHVFEPEAIKNWLSNKSSSCPVCRQQFPSRSLSQSPMSSSIINHPFGSLLTPSDLLRAVSIVHEADNDSHVNQALAALPAIQRQLSELYEPTLVDSGILD